MTAWIQRLKATIQAHRTRTGKSVALANSLHSEATQAMNRVAAELAGSSGVDKVVAEYGAVVKAAEAARDAAVRADAELRKMLERVGTI